MSLGTSREQSNNGPVNGHGLIGLILDCERVGHTDPSINKAFVKHNGLLKVLSGNLVLFAVEVVSSDHEPTNRVTCVVLDQIMGCVIEFTRQA